MPHWCLSMHTMQSADLPAFLSFFPLYLQQLFSIQLVFLNSTHLLILYIWQTRSFVIGHCFFNVNLFVYRLDKPRLTLNETKFNWHDFNGGKAVSRCCGVDPFSTDLLGLSIFIFCRTVHKKHSFLKYFFLFAHLSKVNFMWPETEVFSTGVLISSG